MIWKPLAVRDVPRFKRLPTSRMIFSTFRCGKEGLTTPWDELHLKPFGTLDQALMWNPTQNFVFQHCPKQLILEP